MCVWKSALDCTARVDQGKRRWKRFRIAVCTTRARPSPSPFINLSAVHTTMHRTDVAPWWIISNIIWPTQPPYSIYKSIGEDCDIFRDLLGRVGDVLIPKLTIFRWPTPFHGLPRGIFTNIRERRVPHPSTCEKFQLVWCGRIWPRVCKAVGDIDSPPSWRFGYRARVIIVCHGSVSASVCKPKNPAETFTLSGTFACQMSRRGSPRANEHPW